MSKSGGNAISAVKATEQYGADVLRLYVASLDYADDVRMSERGIKEMSEAYRKIRNTFRYLLGTSRITRSSTRRPSTPRPLHEIDRWALGQLNGVIRDVTRGVRAVRVLPGLSADLPVLLGRPVELLSRRPQGPALRRGSRRPRPPRRAVRAGPAARRARPGCSRRSSRTRPRSSGTSCPQSAAKAASVHLAEWPEPDPAWDDRGDRGHLPGPAGGAGAGPPRGYRAAAGPRSSAAPGGVGPRSAATTPSIAAVLDAARDLLATLASSPRSRSAGPCPPEWHRDGLDLTAPRGSRLLEVAARQVRACWNLRPRDRRPGRPSTRPSATAACGWSHSYGRLCGPDLEARALASDGPHSGPRVHHPDPRCPPSPPSASPSASRGAGRRSQNLIDRIAAGTLRAEIVQVVASQPKIGAIERAEAARHPRRRRHAVGADSLDDVQRRGLRADPRPRGRPGRARRLPRRSWRSPTTTTAASSTSTRP